MWQWVIFYLLVGSLAYIAIYYALLRPKEGYTPLKATPAPTSTTDQLNIVSKSTGFEPQAITIKAGQTVAWTNQSGTNIFVASSPHPAHTDYPALNLGIIKNGESKSLIFPTTGIFRYHNHLNSSQYGSVKVE